MLKRNSRKKNKVKSKKHQHEHPFNLKPVVAVVLVLILILFVAIITFVAFDNPKPWQDKMGIQGAKPAASNSFFDYGFELAVLALLAFSLWGNFRLYKKGEGKNQGERIQKSHRQETTFNRDKETNLERKLGSLEKTIMNLERELSLVRDKNDELTIELNGARQKREIEAAEAVAFEEASTDTKKPKVESFVEEELLIKKHKEKIYFETPYAEGLFDDESKQLDRKFRCIYSIQLDGKEAGELYLEPDYKELDILRNYSDTILKPVCEYMNQFNADFQGIQVLKAGRVVKDGSDWKVKDKLQITFY